MASKQFSIGYFGSQQRFYQKIRELSVSEQYIDVTAGGGGVPYRLLSEKSASKVVTNDLSFYSYICSKTVLEGTQISEEELLAIVEVEDKTNYLSSKDSGIRHGFFNAPLRKFIDGYCIKHKDFPLALAALGKTLLYDCTFRGLAFCKKLANKQRMEDVTVPEFKEMILKHLRYFNKKILEKTESKAFNSNANDFVMNFNEFEGTTVYTDPAWPFNPKLGYSVGENPYLYSSEIIPSILLQSDLVLKLPWNTRDLFTKDRSEKVDYSVFLPELKNKILSDVFLWIDISFEKGAKQFIINTQSTNFPIPEELNQELRDRYPKISYSEAIYNGIGRKNRQFSEFWWSIINQ